MAITVDRANKIAFAQTTGRELAKAFSKNKDLGAVCQKCGNFVTLEEMGAFMKGFSEDPALIGSVVVNGTEVTETAPGSPEVVEDIKRFSEYQVLSGKRDPEGIRDFGRFKIKNPELVKRFSVIDGDSRAFKAGQAVAHESHDLGQDAVRTAGENAGFAGDELTNFQFGYNSIANKAPNFGEEKAHSASEEARYVKKFSAADLEADTEFMRQLARDVRTSGPDERMVSEYMSQYGLTNDEIQELASKARISFGA